MHTLTIVVPTFNEVANIDALLSGLATTAAANSDIDFTVAVVDDSSPDGTADVAGLAGERLDSDNFSVRVMSRKEKNGLGAAYIWAFTTLLSEPDHSDYFLQMDADLSHDPKYVNGFAHQIREGADFVVASRYVPGGGTPDWSLDRKILSRGGNLYTRIMLGSKITDYTGGFNLYSAELLRAIDPATIASTGYGFIMVIKYRALLRAKAVRQIPIVFLDRTNGTSKIPRNTLVKNLILVAEMRFRRKHR